MLIAEMCLNWTDLNMAKEMIRVTKESGADLAKFQLYNAEEDKGKPNYEWIKAHELNFDQAKELFDYGVSIGMEVFFTPFGVAYVDWCEKIGVKRYKIACEFRDLNTLAVINKTKKPVIISSRNGYIKGYRLDDARWLYCVPEYPATITELYNIDFGNDFDGFSDHTIGMDAAKIALACGAKIIEKHFVLEHNPQFPDDAWSMDVKDLKELVRWKSVCKEVLG